MPHSARVSLIIAVCLLGCLILAPRAHADDGDPKHSLEAGRTALTFGLSSSSERLVSFDGSLITFKKQFSRRTALRLGLDLNVDLSDSDSDSRTEMTSIDDDTVTNWDEDLQHRDNDAMGVDLDAVLIHYSGGDRPVHLYYGAGPMVSYAYSRQQNHDEDLLEDLERVRVADSERTTWRLGVRCVLGIEWFAAHWFSLHAEYRVRGNYYHSKSDMETWQISEYTGPTERIEEYIDNGSTTTKDWEIKNDGVVCGASFYF